MDRKIHVYFGPPPPNDPGFAERREEFIRKNAFELVEKRELLHDTLNVLFKNLPNNPAFFAAKLAKLCKECPESRKIILSSFVRLLVSKLCRLPIVQWRLFNDDFPFPSSLTDRMDICRVLPMPMCVHFASRYNCSDAISLLWYRWCYEEDFEKLLLSAKTDPGSVTADAISRLVLHTLPIWELPLQDWSLSSALRVSLYIADVVKEKMTADPPSHTNLFDVLYPEETKLSREKLRLSALFASHGMEHYSIAEMRELVFFLKPKKGLLGRIARLILR